MTGISCRARQTAPPARRSNPPPPPRLGNSGALRQSFAGSHSPGHIRRVTFAGSHGGSFARPSFRRLAHKDRRSAAPSQVAGGPVAGGRASMSPDPKGLGFQSRRHWRFGLRLQTPGGRSSALLPRNGLASRALCFLSGVAPWAGHLPVFFVTAFAVFAAGPSLGCSGGAPLAVGATGKRQSRHGQAPAGDFFQPLPPSARVAPGPFASRRIGRPAFNAAVENSGRHGARSVLESVLASVLASVLERHPRGGGRVCWARRGWQFHKVGKVDFLLFATEERAKRL